MIITSSKALRNNRTDLLLQGMPSLRHDLRPTMRKLITLTGKVSHFYTHMDAATLMSWLAPPLELGQFVCIEEDEILAFTSWAYMGREARQRWLTQTGKIAREDWNSGDEIWGIDAMAINGKGTDLSHLLRKTLRSLGHQGRYCNYTRRYPNGDFRVTRVMI